MKKVIVETEETGKAKPAVAVSTKAEFVTARVEEIRPSATNPRKFFDPVGLQELADSVREQGILQPPVVRPLPRFKLIEPDLHEKDWVIIDESTKAEKDRYPGLPKLSEKLAREHLAKLNEHAYELVAGERRWRATKLAGLAMIPVLVRQLTDSQVREMQVIENLQRSDISPLEEAQGFREWMTQDSVTADQVAERIGKSRSHVFARLKLLKLSEPVRKAVLEGKLSQSLGELVARVPGEASQVKAMEAILEGNEVLTM
jgi:ParB/RepB/Spo0J family partition protein